MFGSLFSTLSSKLVLSLLITSTVVTTGVAAVKVSNSLQAAEVPQRGITIQAVSQLPSITPTPSNVTIQNIVSDLALPVKTVTNGPCIITLFGVKYDVTSLEKMPNGSFNCGGDMTTIYQTKHGTDVSVMSPYLLVKPSPTAIATIIPTSVVSSPTPTQTITPTSIPTSSPTPTLTNGRYVRTYRYSDDEGERNDSENQSRYINQRTSTEDRDEHDD